MIGFAEHKGIITLRPGFGPLQATVLHQLKGERHIMNLQTKKVTTIFWHLEVQLQNGVRVKKKMISQNWIVEGPKAVISEIHTQALDIRREPHITPLIRFLCRGRLQMHPGATCPFGTSWACWMWPRWAACTLGWLSTPPPLNDTQHSTPGWLSTLKHANRRCTHNLYLLVKILRGQEEVVEGDEVSFQKSHQQDQIHTICKLQTRLSQIPVEHGESRNANLHKIIQK